MIDIPSQNLILEHLGTTRTWWRTDTGEVFKAKIEIKLVGKQAASIRTNRTRARL